MGPKWFLSTFVHVLFLPVHANPLPQSLVLSLVPAASFFFAILLLPPTISSSFLQSGQNHSSSSPSPANQAIDFPMHLTWKAPEHSSHIIWLLGSSLPPHTLQPHSLHFFLQVHQFVLVVPTKLTLLLLPWGFVRQQLRKLVLHLNHFRDHGLGILKFHHLVDKLDFTVCHSVFGAHTHFQGLQAASTFPPCHLGLIPPSPLLWLFHVVVDHDVNAEVEVREGDYDLGPRSHFLILHLDWSIVRVAFIDNVVGKAIPTGNLISPHYLYDSCLKPCSCLPIPHIKPVPHLVHLALGLLGHLHFLLLLRLLLDILLLRLLLGGQVVDFPKWFPNHQLDHIVHL